MRLLDRQKLRNTDLPNKIRLTSVGGNYLGVAKAGTGKVDVLLWGVGQFGSWGNQDHRAGAVALEAGYQFKGDWLLEEYSER